MFADDNPGIRQKHFLLAVARDILDTHAARAKTADDISD